MVSIDFGHIFSIFKLITGTYSFWGLNPELRRPQNTPMVAVDNVEHKLRHEERRRDGATKPLIDRKPVDY